MTSRVDCETRSLVTDFLYRESLLLDARRFREWLSMFADDAIYEAPVRVVREKDAAWELSPRSRIFDDTKQTLEIRIARLETEFAWAEQPPSRTRHYLTNILVDPGEQPDSLVVWSNCLVYRSRGDLGSHDLFSTQRRDVLRRHDGTFLIVHRLIALDQSTVKANNLSIML
jgi:3-phenylpropionate/cinnamic acid dioxygenase small subunit